jgi:hypothetical protein
MNDICKISYSNFFAKDCQTNIKKIYCTFEMITIEKNEDFSSYSCT